MMNRGKGKERMKSVTTLTTSRMWLNKNPPKGRPHRDKQGGRKGLNEDGNCTHHSEDVDKGEGFIERALFQEIGDQRHSHKAQGQE